MKTTIALLLFMNMIILGCDNMKDTIDIDNGSIQTELGILPKLISLPRQPVTVKWMTEKVRRDESALTVLLKFNEMDYNYIINHSQPLKRKTNDMMWPKLYDKWLPEDAKTGIEAKLVGDVYELIGIRGLEANLFSNPDLSSYIHGSITPLKNDYILVVLYAM